MSFVNLSIPRDKVECVRKYLESLETSSDVTSLSSDVTSSSSDVTSSDATSSSPDADKYEVESIDDHSCHPDGSISFKIKFKGYKNVEWINDKDCDCERIIASYCGKNGISTAYCFCRVSTKNQVGVDHVSLEAQEAEIKKSVDMELYHRLKIIKISASAYKNIPAQLAEIGDIANEHDLIAIYRVDRLSRNIVKYMGWLEDLNDRGVKIYSCVEKLYYRENKLDFLQGIMNANKESALLGERIKMSIKHRRQRGDESIGRLKYGKKYKRTSDGHLVVVDDQDAMGVLSLIKTMKNNNKTFEEISAYLNKNGYKKNGREWSKKMVADVFPKQAKTSSSTESTEESDEEIIPKVYNSKIYKKIVDDFHIIDESSDDKLEIGVIELVKKKIGGVVTSSDDYKRLDESSDDDELEIVKKKIGGVIASTDDYKRLDELTEAKNLKRGNKNNSRKRKF